MWLNEYLGHNEYSLSDDSDNLTIAEGAGCLKFIQLGSEMVIWRPFVSFDLLGSDLSIFVLWMN